MNASERAEIATLLRRAVALERRLRALHAELHRVQARTERYPDRISGVPVALVLTLEGERVPVPKGLYLDHETQAIAVDLEAVHEAIDNYRPTPLRSLFRSAAASRGGREAGGFA